MNPKDRTEGSPPTATGMDADVTTAARRKSLSKCPEAESATGTAERNLLEQILAPVRWMSLFYANAGVPA